MRSSVVPSPSYTLWRGAAPVVAAATPQVKRLYRGLSYTTQRGTKRALCWRLDVRRFGDNPLTLTLTLTLTAHSLPADPVGAMMQGLALAGGEGGTPPAAASQMLGLLQMMWRHR